MAESSASVTMPQNKPNDEKPASPPSIATSSDGEDVVIQVSPTPAANKLNDVKKQETAAVKEVVNSAETKDETAKEEGSKVTELKEVVGGNDDNKIEPVQDNTSNEGTPTPVKDAASAETRPGPKLSHDEETKAKHFIGRAHGVIHGTSTAVFKTEEDITKLTEMVSQLTHLLAACGVGKDTTARALAYVNGPEKLNSKAAVIQAKQDRRNKGLRRASGATRAPRKTANGSEANDEDRGEKLGSEKGASTTSQSIDQKNDTPSSAIVSTSDEHGDGPRSQNSDSAGVKQSPFHQKDEAASTETNGQSTDKVEKPKKRFGRGKWGGWRRRNENKKKEGDKAVGGQEPIPAVVDSTKEATVTVDEQKDQPGLAPVQVAPAA